MRVAVITFSEAEVPVYMKARGGRLGYAVKLGGISSEREEG